MFPKTNKVIEPFNYFGVNSIISSEKEAYEVIQKNSYYTYLYAYVNFFFAFIFLYESQTKDIGLLADFIIYLIVGLVFLIFAYLIKNKLNKLILGLYALFPIGSFILSGGTGFMMLLHVFTLMAMYRIYKAINVIQEINKKELEDNNL